MRRIVWALTVVAVFLTVPATGQAQQAMSPEAARAFIEKMGQRTLNVLQANNSPQRSADLGRLLLDAIDFDSVAMQTLGRYGRKPDSQDFREFSTLFATYIIDLAIEKFGALPIRGYSIAGANQFPNGDVMINTTVSPEGGNALNTGWRVRQTGAGPKIVDISVDGYSMVTHFNGQYADWLSKAGLAGLVTKLRSQTRNSPSLALVQQVRG